MATSSKTGGRRAPRRAAGQGHSSNGKKRNGLPSKSSARVRETIIIDPRQQQQHKQFEDAMRYFHEQKFLKAKQAFEKAIDGPTREFVDRALIYIRTCEKRISRSPETAPRSVEEHYHHGVAMMNLGRWEESRQALDRARKLSPKADFIYYALAALDSLTGEAESAMTNLKMAIELHPENRYHARNDEDFAYLFEDPRFTELLYPEREGPSS